MFIRFVRPRFTQYGSQTNQLKHFIKNIAYVSPLGTGYVPEKVIHAGDQSFRHQKRTFICYGGAKVHSAYFLFPLPAIADVWQRRMESFSCDLIEY